ncbi:hypothetical protein BRADI_4g03140v3 [Brachypodium distachyon]|uniref:PDZ domain-containing protein n=1 Tax=Brachypodium distachyon TaxID=15368 RepID=A0A2K2CK75_BRADI|nr:hypothetical protein BRADI_4g03140v3 [Brachypodium distachyon]
MRRPQRQTPRQKNQTFLLRSSPRRAGATASSNSRPAAPRRGVHWPPPLSLSPLSPRQLLLRRYVAASRLSKPYSFSAAAPDTPCGGAMAGPDDGKRSGKRRHAPVDRPSRPRTEDKKKPRRRSSQSQSQAPPSSEVSPPPTAPSEEEHGGVSAEVEAMVLKQLRQFLATDAIKTKEIAELMKDINGERTLTVESSFGDTDDGSLESLEARKVALLVSQSIVSLSSFAGGKRIRVCSGFVMCWNCSPHTSMILTSATLVRSLNGDNNVISGLIVKVLLPDGNITDGYIILNITGRAGVLALGRAYEGCNLMCSRGQVINKTSIFGCSELLVSSCEISMAGSGGPLVNYDGQVVGINFYEENQTSFIPLEIVSRILEHHQNFSKIIHPWLGLRYTSLQTVPLEILEPIYQKFPDVEKGLYISNVVEGSPADLAGLCVGDVIVKCGGEDLSSAPEFGAMLLNACKEHVKSNGGSFGDYAEENMTVEIMIKQQRDGSTVSKSIAADVLKELHYNRWPAPMPSYKIRLINVTRYR